MSGYHHGRGGRYYSRGASSGQGGFVPSSRGGFSQGGTSLFRSRLSGDGPPGRDILEGLVEEPLKVFHPGDAPAMGNIVLDDVQYLASYSWIESKEPTMLVPGCPRKWLNKPVPFQVTPDSGGTFVDQDASRMPGCPFVPLFRAVDTMEKERDGDKVDWSSVDIITDRNNLRKLLAWVQGGEEFFRIDVQLAGSWTMLLQRWEERPLEISDGYGFGDSFELAATVPAPGCEEATLAGHHRIISYDFAGLKLIIRCEVDAYDPSLCKSESVRKPAGIAPATSSKSVDPLDDLTGAISALKLSKPTSSDDTASPDGLRIIRAGTVVPQSALLKIKTRSERNIGNFNWDSVYPQLFIGQTRTHMIGVHRRGSFYEVQRKTLDDPELRDVAKKVQAGLKKLRHALEEIHTFIMAQGKQARLSLVCTDGSLKVMERKSTDSFVPADILKRFET